jgi:hypothetical protein
MSVFQFPFENGVLCPLIALYFVGCALKRGGSIAAKALLPWAWLLLQGMSGGTGLV